MAIPSGRHVHELKAGNQHQILQSCKASEELSRRAHPSHCTRPSRPGSSQRDLPEDDVVVEVLELRDGLTLKALWDARITCGFEAGPLKTVQASEVWLPRLPGIDLVPKVVEDLGRTVPRGIGCERRSF